VRHAAAGVRPRCRNSGRAFPGKRGGTQTALRVRRIAFLGNSTAAPETNLTEPFASSYSGSPARGSPKKRRAANAALALPAASLRGEECLQEERQPTLRQRRCCGTSGGLCRASHRRSDAEGSNHRPARSCGSWCSTCSPGRAFARHRALVHVRAALALTIRKPLSRVFRALGLCSSRLIRDASDAALPFPFRKPRRRASV
jgi:hypothetical protein